MLPDLPTLDEAGLKGFEVTAWHAMWAPRGLPAEVSQRLTGALQAALKDPKVTERLVVLGAISVPLQQATPQALAAPDTNDFTSSPFSVTESTTRHLQTSNRK